MAEQAAKAIEEAVDLFREPAPASQDSDAQPDVARGLAEKLKGDAAKSRCGGTQ